jgi:predicted nuclease with TOPRIM domain
VNQAIYQQWWQIHVRVARGELLSPEEEILYEAGRQELEKDEQQREMNSVRELREKLSAMEREHGQLDERRQQLHREIAALEQQLPQHTQLVLGIEE